MASQRKDMAKTEIKAITEYHKKHAKVAMVDMTGENAELMEKLATNAKSWDTSRNVADQKDKATMFPEKAHTKQYKEST